MKKFLAIVAIVCMISGSLNAGIKCNDGCLQAHFQKPGHKTCTDIYHRCCSAIGYKHGYTKCINGCDFGYNKSRADNEQLYADCQAHCISTQTKRLELPNLKCAPTA